MYHNIGKSYRKIRKPVDILEGVDWLFALYECTLCSKRYERGTEMKSKKAKIIRTKFTYFTIAIIGVSVVCFIRKEKLVK